MEHPILLFDGVCNLCERSVRFIIPRDPKGKFRFAPLQSPIGQGLLGKFGLSQTDLTTMVLVEGERVFTCSDAALRIAKELSGLWPLFYVFWIVPRFIRNVVYRWVVRNRYRWFGKKEECMVPTPEMKARFLG